MAVEQGFCAQVVIIRRKDLDNKKEKENTNKYNFQGWSTISKRWFYLDHEWLEKTCSTCEPEFYKKLYQVNIEG